MKEGVTTPKRSEDCLKCLFIMACSEAGKMNEILYNHDSATLPAQEFPAVPCEKMVFFFHITILLLIKHVGPRWLDIGLVLFLQVYGWSGFHLPHAEKNPSPKSTHLDLMLSQ